jgi:hypothetical protein
MAGSGESPAAPRCGLQAKVAYVIDRLNDTNTGDEGPKRRPCELNLRGCGKSTAA